MPWNTRVHGHTRPTRTKTYQSWNSMRDRCNNPNNPRWKDYGGRGIKVCERWNSFENFLADMGPRPSGDYSLGRVDNDGDYKPGNCRWETRKEQMRNRRANVFVLWHGEMLTLMELSERLNLNYSTFCKRLSRGWSLDDATKQPNPNYVR